MYQEDIIWDADFFQITFAQIWENKLDPHEPTVLFLVKQGQQKFLGASRSKEPLRVGGTPRSSIQTLGVELHQNISCLSIRSCSHIIGLCTCWVRISHGIRQIPGLASHTNWGYPLKAGPGQIHGAGTRGSLLSHPQNSGTGPEKGRISHSHHPENSSL